MNAATKIQKAKIQLILNQPFFATVAMHLRYVESPGEKTAATDGLSVFYNPEYINRLTMDELIGMLAHEVMHITLLHHTRRNNRDKGRWNRAADYAINPLLQSTNFVLPHGFLDNPAFHSKTAEQIYNLLPPPQVGSSGPNENPRNHGSSAPPPYNLPILNPDDGGTGDVLDLPHGVSPQACEADIKQLVTRAKMIAKQQGKMPAFLERLIETLLEPHISWQEVLARFLSEVTREDYTWKKPSSRYLHTGLYLPALESRRMGNLILIADTSISIDHKMLNQFAGEAQDIAAMSHIGLTVIYVDVAVQGVEEFAPDDPIQLHPKGGGGTDFRPGFNYIEQHQLQPTAVIYLTDGECTRFPIAPNYPVLWAQFGEEVFEPPFGEVIQVA
jgi:predicted metal-dependent peptidase